MSGKIGNQTPTQSVILPYKKSAGAEAVKLYNASGRKAIKWQADLVKDIMGMDSSGLWVHQKFGFSVPRRNGKNEIVAIRELWGLVHGEKMCHTAHRTTTSHQAWDRLVRILSDSGYSELGRAKKGEAPPEKSYRLTKQYGLESIKLTDGGEIVFRTRTVNGGLGEGFDLLVIDEAQEYTTAHESALVYTVSDSKNPQTIFCGTPPTTTSVGTVFPKMREQVLGGEGYDSGWAEWSVDRKPAKLMDPELWYQTNPSMGYHLDERKIRAEYRPEDELDFLIQRLGYWFQYSLKSAITEDEWKALEVPRAPKLEENRYFGVKFGADGLNGCLSVASRTLEGKIFVEAIDCRPIRDGIDWMLPYLQNPHCKGVVVDGKRGQQMLVDRMKEAKLKAPLLPTVPEIIVANATFESAIFDGGIQHIDQMPLTNAVSNCEHRNIGTNGGFGYKTMDEKFEVALVESVSLAYWMCSKNKAKKKQRVSF